MAEKPGFDERVAEAMEKDFDGLIEELRKAATSEVKAKLVDEPCEKCGCKHIRYISTPDWKTKIDIAEFLATRGFGRPGQAVSEESGERVVFQRLVEMPAE